MVAIEMLASFCIGHLACGGSSEVAAWRGSLDLPLGAATFAASRRDAFSELLAAAGRV